MPSDASDIQPGPRTGSPFALKYGAQRGLAQGPDKFPDFFPQGPKIAIFDRALKQRLKQTEHRQMNAPTELNFEEMLRIRLEVLRREHRDLDDAIHALATAGRADQLTLQRLKRQKLSLKDQIVRIEDQLIPDIIA